jgi:hypothetical protein
MPSGYSGTPLAAKLGLKAGQRVWRDGMPASVADEIGEIGAILLQAPAPPIDLAHIFVTERKALTEQLTALYSLLAPAGAIWVSWPKKAAKVATDVTEDTICDICLPMGLVDVKVCAVDTIWSGLKLVIRKDRR